MPKEIYYEKNVWDYPLGRELMERYLNMGIPGFEIENHNNIEQMRKQPNAHFGKMKQNLIIGIRKTHKYVPNHKVSDFLVPFTSSGCTAMCLYCYLVCNYNKCAYLRLFVNREQMMDKLIKTANNCLQPLTFEIGSNSDLVLENTITNNLAWTITEFAKTNQGFITFPTKFDQIDNLLPLQHNGRTLVRMSVNPSKIISRIELGTSSLDKRISAINKLSDADYPIGILVAPIIFVEDWKRLYEELFEKLYDQLNQKAKRRVFFEVIFMTYSYVHRMINKEAFPKAPDLYSVESMTGRGMGKYVYRKPLQEEGEAFIRQLFEKYFPQNRLYYIV